MLLNGWLLLDKAVGISSAKAISYLKKSLNLKSKIGHAGTLDPFASGLLLVGVGKATKLMQYAIVSDKHYEFDMVWGENKDTNDITGSTTSKSNYIPDEQEIQNIIQQFTGNVSQVPPQYSAISINGIRAYTLARNNINVTLDPRNVICYELKVIKHQYCDSLWTTSFFLHCSSGFYVRALARDMALQLNTCGYVSNIRRIKIGKFSVANAITMGYIDYVAKSNIDIIKESLLKMECILDYSSAINVCENIAMKLISGCAINIVDVGLGNYKPNTAIPVFYNSDLLAICFLDNKGVIYPKSVLVNKI